MEICVCNVRKCHQPPMSDVFLADTVDSTADDSLGVQHLRYSVTELHIQLASLDRTEQLTRCFSAVAELLVFHIYNAVQ